MPLPKRRADFAIEFQTTSFEIWSNSLSGLYRVSLPERYNPERFSFSGVTYSFGRSFLSRAVGTPFFLERDAAHIARFPQNFVSLFFCEVGRVDYDYDGTAGILAAGDLVVLDCARPIFSHSTAYRCTTIFVEREQAPLPFRSGQHHGSVLRADRAEATHIRECLGALVSTIDGMTAGDAGAAVRALIGHVARLWPFDAAAGGPAEDQMSRAIAIIKDNLTNPMLSAALIASSAGISRAQLYRLFAHLGGVRTHILNMRLDAAFDSLVDRRAASIGRIAQLYGFRTASHFSRSFRARFQTSPSAVAASGETDASLLLSQLTSARAEPSASERKTTPNR